MKAREKLDLQGQKSNEENAVGCFKLPAGKPGLRQSEYQLDYSRPRESRAGSFQVGIIIHTPCSQALPQK